MKWIKYKHKLNDDRSAYRLNCIGNDKGSEEINSDQDLIGAGISNDPTTPPVSVINTKSESDVREQLRVNREVTVKKDDGANQNAAVSNIITEDFMDVDEEFIDSLKVKRPYLSIILERFMQTIDDYQLSSKLKKIEQLSQVTIQMNELQKTNPIKEKIIVLGSGWAGHAFLKTVDAFKYDVTVISPRNYFTFTPMLAASAVGTVDFRSICQPIRNVNSLANYLEASAVSVDFEKKQIQCQSIKCEGTACDMTEFDVPYDYLLIAVGATTNTFGVKGVRENCQFLKQVEDAQNLRKAIAYCFERANIPNLSEEEIRNALSFVVVGAGPTGVEFTSELRDWLEYEGRRYYSKLLQYVRITLVEAGSTVLPVFDESLQREAYKQLTNRNSKLISDKIIRKEITQVLLKAGVKEVKDKFIELSNGDQLPYGFCVWAAGNGPIPFILKLIDENPEQKNNQQKLRGRISTDRWLRVNGAKQVFAIGDCAVIEDSALPATAQVASQQGSYLGRLFSKGFSMQMESPLPPTKTTINAPSEEMERDGLPINDSGGASMLNHSQTDEVRFASDRIKLGKLGIEKEIRISKENGLNGTSHELIVEYAKPFQFLNLGVLAYIGASQALAQISVDNQLIKGKGSLGFLLWRGIYWFKQVSWRNRLLVSIDWFKARVFGRDLGSI